MMDLRCSSGSKDGDISIDRDGRSFTSTVIATRRAWNTRAVHLPQTQRGIWPAPSLSNEWSVRESSSMGLGLETWGTATIRDTWKYTYPSRTNRHSFCDNEPTDIRSSSLVSLLRRQISSPMASSSSQVASLKPALPEQCLECP